MSERNKKYINQDHSQISRSSQNEKVKIINVSSQIKKSFLTPKKPNFAEDSEKLDNNLIRRICSSVGLDKLTEEKISYKRNNLNLLNQTQSPVDRYHAKSAFNSYMINEYITNDTVILNSHRDSTTNDANNGQFFDYFSKQLSGHNKIPKVTKRSISKFKKIVIGSSIAIDGDLIGRTLAINQFQSPK